MKLKTWKDVREFLNNGDYLLLKCRRCEKEFRCSGHCILEMTNWKPFKYIYADKKEAEPRECICGVCDRSDVKWMNKCMKDFPWSWILENGKKRNTST